MSIPVITRKRPRSLPVLGGMVDSIVDAISTQILIGRLRRFRE
jgi:hypothetical protein